MHVPINVKSPNNISKWQMGFNSAFKGLIQHTVIKSLFVLLDIHMYTQVRYSGEFIRFMWLGVPSVLLEVFLIYLTLLYVANTCVSSEVQNARGAGNA